jgi:hypothetical protein
VPALPARGPVSLASRGRCAATSMSSRTVTTTTTSAPPRGASGFHLGTLIVAAISAVVAATVVSRIWQPGTVMATAMTPVLITLVKEALERPARRVTSLAGRGTAVPIEPERRPEPIGSPPAVVVTEDEGLTPMRVYRPGRRVRRRWKLAIATGLLAFIIAVAAMTLPELVAGRSVVSASHDTTIFGGRRHTAASTSTPAKRTKTTQDTVSTEQQTPQDTTSTEQQTTTTTPIQPAAPAPQTQTQTTPPTQTQPPTTTQPPAAQTQPAPTTP